VCVPSFGDGAVVVVGGELAIVSESGVARLRYSDRVGAVLSASRRGANFTVRQGQRSDARRSDSRRVS
jgi:hypothetical protein